MQLISRLKIFENNDLIFKQLQFRYPPLKTMNHNNIHLQLNLLVSLIMNFMLHQVQIPLP